MGGAAMRRNPYGVNVPLGISPIKSDIGRKVVYRTAPQFEPEEGIITSYNDSCVFVRYGEQPNSKATSRCDLDFVWS